eukprot:GHVT01092640.1.p2 GENE.GHVT01092640.1~~GHVT01092640.1.p2  ORF type:complete len:106 (+),score=10.14 GHVT01092640.1:122-439(+)
MQGAEKLNNFFNWKCTALCFFFPFILSCFNIDTALSGCSFKQCRSVSCIDAVPNVCGNCSSAAMCRHKFINVFNVFNILLKLEKPPQMKGTYQNKFHKPLGRIHK